MRATDSRRSRKKEAKLLKETQRRSRGKGAKAKENRSLCPCGSHATIKEQISTSIVCPVIVVSPENVLVPHRTHSLIVDVQPSFATIVAAAPRAAVTVRVENIERIMSATCRHAMVVEHTIERVARGLRGWSGSRCHDICTDRYFQPRLKEAKKKRKNTYRVGFQAPT